MSLIKKKKKSTISKEETSRGLAREVILAVVIALILWVGSIIKTKYIDKPSDNEQSIQKVERLVDDLSYLFTDLGQKVDELSESYLSSVVSFNESIKERDEKIEKNRDELKEQDKRLALLEQWKEDAN